MTTSPSLSPPRLVATATLADGSPFAPEAAVVEAPRCIEVMTRVAGGFVDWELGGPTREQQ